jgi:hypothetical protein
VVLEAGTARVEIESGPGQEFGLAAISLIRKADWREDFLSQVANCVRVEGVCVDQWFPPAQNAITTEAESAKNSEKGIAGSKLPFAVADAEHAVVVALDRNQVVFSRAHL